MDKLIILLLRKFKIYKIAINDLNLKLISHSEYPSVKAITDTLDYFGIENVGGSQNMKLFAVGVDANGDDLYNGLILDHSVPCPPMCGKPNPLNGNV